MNRQIGELTSLVRTLTEKSSSSNREENGSISSQNRSPSHSDMVRGVTSHSVPTPQLDPPRRTLMTIQPPQIQDVTSEIHSLRNTMTDGISQRKILQTQMPLFKGNREKFNEFEDLLSNHLRPYLNKLNEEQKLNYFPSLLRDEAVDF